MTILDQNGMEFFQKELLTETRTQIRAYELLADDDSETSELGRIRLYEERGRIHRHFAISEKDIGGYESHYTGHGLIGKVLGDTTSSILYWKEKAGMRYAVFGHLNPELSWIEKTPPDVRLTPEPKFIRKKRILKELQ